MTERNIDYKRAYERQIKARNRAEDILETKSRELYEKNLILEHAYNTLAEKNALILHQEKLASIGQLAAGVAHEINNPVGYVKSNLGSLKKYITHMHKLVQAYDSLAQASGDTPEQQAIKELQRKISTDFLLEDTQSLIEECLEGTARIEEIVKSLKSFARRDGNNEETTIEQYLDLNACINDTIKLVWNEIKYTCELKLDLNDIPPIRGCPGELCQVIVNLLVNACQAIESKGDITISTQVKDNEVLLSITDTGKGIPSDILENIFDPFFTTKDVNKGTGLGLSISHGIINKMNGRIDVKSKLNHGSCFSLYFPIDNAVASMADDYQI